MKTITLPDDIARETMIALRDRKVSLQCEIESYPDVGSHPAINPSAVRAIAARQLKRVDAALAFFSAALGEKF